MFHEIKRYRNRKLYSSKLKGYITLEDVVQFIKQGDEVIVVEHKTGFDVTNPVLSQALLTIPISNTRINQLIRGEL